MWEILLPPAVEVKSLLFQSLTNAGYCQTLKFMPIWWVWNRALFSIYFSFIAVEHLFMSLGQSVFFLYKLPAPYFHVLIILLDYFFLLIFKVSHAFSTNLLLFMWIANIYPCLLLLFVFLFVLPFTIKKIEVSV